MLHGFACDAAGETLVVFGGVASGAGLDDTWLGRLADGTVRWRRLPSASAEHGPGRRFGFAYAFDDATKRFLVQGGQLLPAGGASGMQVAHDLWALDFAADEPAWTELATWEPSDFPGRRNPAFSLDRATGDLVVFGGTGDGRTALPDLFVVRTREPDAPVERVPQPDAVVPRASCFAVADPTRRRVLLGFGNDARGPLLDLIEVRRAER